MFSRIQNFFNSVESKEKIKKIASEKKFETTFGKIRRK